MVEINIFANLKSMVNLLRTEDLYFLGFYQQLGLGEYGGAVIKLALSNF